MTTAGSVLRLHIYLSPTHASVIVETVGLWSQTSGSSMPVVLQRMPPDDKATFIAFCQSVLDTCHQQ